MNKNLAIPQHKCSLSRILMVLLFTGMSVGAQAQINFILHLDQMAARLDSAQNALPIYISGDFTDWNPADESFRMTKRADGTYGLTADLQPGRHMYKYTRGNWETVEITYEGQDSPNRTLEFSDGLTTHDTVLAFRDQKPSMSAPLNPRIIVRKMYIPQLDRHRNIRIYLPPDYDHSNDRYGVLYMHDGQNLFDDATSYAGEWGVDECLDTLFNADSFQAPIVVGIDNSEFRLNEYSFYDHEKFGKAQGRAYAAFLTQTLKPLIDSLYRTKPDRLHTGIMGSSMGGLISLLTAFEYPEVYGKVGCISPAFRYAADNFEFIDTVALPQQMQIYFLIGQMEALTGRENTAHIGNMELPSFVLDMLQVYNTLLRRKMNGQNLYCEVTPGADHNEQFWRSKLPDVLLWLWKD